MLRSHAKTPQYLAGGGLPHVMIVSPDSALRKVLRAEVERVDPVEIVEVARIQDAIAHVKTQLPAVLLADTVQDGLDGFKLCKLLKLPLKPGAEQIPVILFSNTIRDVLAEHVGRKSNAFAFLNLPGDLVLVARTVELALHRLLPQTNDRQLLNQKGYVQLVGQDETLMRSLVGALANDGWKVDQHKLLAGAVKTWEAAAPQVLVIESGTTFESGWLPEQLGGLIEPAVVMLLKRAEPEDALAYLESGVDDFVHLPCDTAAVVTAVRDARQKYNFRSMHRQFEAQLEKLKELSDYLDLVITNSHEAIFTCDSTGKVRLWNKGAERVYGYAAEEIIGRNIDDHLDPPGFSRKSPHVVRLLEQRGSMTDPEVQRMRKSGEVFPVSATYTLLRDSHGTVLGFSVIERDVTPIKALENEKIKSARLRAITQTAVTANDHINTPLGIILGYAQFLEMKLADIDQQDKAALDVIQQQVHKIKGIMNKLKLISDPIVKNYSIEGVTMLDLANSQLSNEAAN